MTKSKESITIKKNTFIIAIIVIIAIIAALASVYYLNLSKTDKVETKEIGSLEPVEIDVTAIIVKECGICINMTEVVQELKLSPFVNVRQSNILFASAREAKQFISNYDIKKLPTIILHGDTDKLPLKGFEKVEDGAFLEDVPPPYVDLEKKEIEGLVDITYITDDSCAECYDAKQHKEIMQLAFGMYIDNEKTFDISSKEGKALLKEYSITKVPTIILSEEAKDYPAMKIIWEQIGTVEEDGKHVFRGFEMTQDIIYKDLETNQLINTSELQEE